MIFYGSKNTPENLNKWCSENAVSPSEVIQFIEYDYLTAFTDFLSEEPKTSVSFTLKFVATTSALVQFEEKETKSLQYEIEWKSSIENQSSSQATTSWNHFIITGLTPNTEYNIRARVRTEFGHVSKWSKNSSFITLKSKVLVFS